jgi:hypothetical protein
MRRQYGVRFYFGKRYFLPVAFNRGLWRARAILRQGRGKKGFGCGGKMLGCHPTPRIKCLIMTCHPLVVI